MTLTISLSIVLTIYLIFYNLPPINPLFITLKTFAFTLQIIIKRLLRKKY